MYFVYVLRSESTRKLYTGSTEDLEKRLIEHNTGLSFSTKNRGPWVVVHSESFETRAEAFRREQELKTGKGRDELRRILSGRQFS